MSKTVDIPIAAAKRVADDYGYDQVVIVARKEHPSNNDVLKAPPGATADECRALPITRVLYQPSNMPAVVSYWQPSPEQLKLLNAGRPVWLSIIGRTHPPLAIGVDGDGRLD